MKIDRLIEQGAAAFLARFERVPPAAQARWDKALEQLRADLEAGYPAYREKARRRELQTALLARTTFLG